MHSRQPTDRGAEDRLATLEAALRGLPADCRGTELHALGEFVLAAEGRWPRFEPQAFLAAMRDPSASVARRAAAGALHGTLRLFAAGDEAQREVLRQQWLAMRERVFAALQSHLAQGHPLPPAAMPQPVAEPAASDGTFILDAYERLAGRGCRISELRAWQRRFARGECTREQVLEQARREAPREQHELGSAGTDTDDAPPVDDDFSLHVMGTGERVTLRQWRERALQLPAARPPAPMQYRHRFHLRGDARLRVTAIASLYKGGAHIERFMDNLVGQQGFADFVELVIIDAASPDDEARTIARYLRNHPNIRYLRTASRIGVYEAWNMAVGMARGEYLTNTNVDDLRRADSLEMQAATLDNLPFVDVVYQDLWYSFDPDLRFERVAAMGWRTRLPLVVPRSLLDTNSPHNAPMWRRRLHEEVGLFDTRYRSAGDYDFWLRCLAQGKRFYKLNDPSVVYYQNPQGLSTRADTLGHQELDQILLRQARGLVPRELVDAFDAFCAGSLAGVPVFDAWRVREDRAAQVDHALRDLARRERPWWQSPAARVPRLPKARPRLVVDGAVFDLDPYGGVGAYWRELMAELVRQPVEVTLLDRGHAPWLPGVRGMPFPSWQVLQDTAADSLLLQQVCEAVGADAFLSTTLTSVAGTPMLWLAREAPAPGVRGNPWPGEPWLWREWGLAEALSQFHVCESEEARRALLERQPMLPPSQVEVAQGPDAASVAALLARGAAALAALRDDAALQAFSGEWRRWRTLQATVDA